jgi:hypothetical protein
MGADVQDITARTQIDPWIKGQQRYITEDAGQFLRKPYEPYRYDMIADQGRLGEHSRNVMGNLAGYRGQASTLFQPVDPTVGGWNENRVKGQFYRSGAGPAGELHRTFGTQSPDQYDIYGWKGGSMSGGDPGGGYNPTDDSPPWIPPNPQEWDDPNWWVGEGIDKPEGWDTWPDFRKQEWMQNYGDPDYSYNQFSGAKFGMGSTPQNVLSQGGGTFTADDRATLNALLQKQGTAALTDSDRALLLSLQQRASGGGFTPQNALAAGTVPGVGGVPTIGDPNLGFTPFTRYEDQYDPATGFAGFGAGRADFGLGASQLWDASDRARAEAGYAPIDIGAQSVVGQAGAGGLLGRRYVDPVTGQFVTDQQAPPDLRTDLATEGTKVDYLDPGAAGYEPTGFQDLIARGAAPSDLRTDLATEATRVHYEDPGGADYDPIKRRWSQLVGRRYRDPVTGEYDPDFQADPDLRTDLAVEPTKVDYLDPGAEGYEPDYKEASRGTVYATGLDADKDRLDPLGDLIEDPEQLRATQLAQDVTGARELSADDITGYMSPYTENVLAETIADIEEQQAMANLGISAAATSQGAWGGDREVLARQLSDRDFERLKARETALANEQAFQFATDQARRDVDLQAAREAQMYEGGLAGRLQEGREQTGVSLANAARMDAARQADLDRAAQAMAANQRVGADVAFQNVAAENAARQADLNRAAQAMASNQATGLSVSQANLAAQTQQRQADYNRAAQAMEANQRTGLQTSLANQGMFASDADRALRAAMAQQQAGLAGSQVRTAAARDLGLGGQAIQQAGFGAVNQLDALAARDAAIKQATIDADMQQWYESVYGPRDDFAMRNALLQGLPVGQTETTQYPGQPLWQQILQGVTGAGATAAGAYGAIKNT